mgnify:CR=1 FL=1
MNDLIKNNTKLTCHQVLIEKLNNFSQEMMLWDILILEYGFKRKPFGSFRDLTFLEKIMVKLKIPLKPKPPMFHNDWLYAYIDGVKFDVIFDSWSVSLMRNDLTIFDQTRFDNKDFLKLLD